KGIAATIKHFVGNEQETERQAYDAVIAERPLREIYLKPFEIAVREASPWALMSSYNMWRNFEQVKEGLENGELEQKDIEDAAARVLYLVDRTKGLGNKTPEAPEQSIDNVETRNLI
nr:putative beta-glucosidase E [Tanacetum cinerariifolium]